MLDNNALVLSPVIAGGWGMPGETGVRLVHRIGTEQIGYRCGEVLTT